MSGRPNSIVGSALPTMCVPLGLDEQDGHEECRDRDYGWAEKKRGCSKRKAVKSEHDGT